MSQFKYTSEVELKNALGIESWRNLSKETVLQLLYSLPEVDREVALKVIDQIPEITALARVVLDDAAKAYDGALTSNDRSMEMAHRIHLDRLRILEAELGKDLTPEQWLRVLDDMRDVESNALLKDTENKTFISAQLRQRLATGGLIFVGVIALLFAAGRSPSSSN